ncbi:glycolate oxidase subunit GlcF [Thiohalocapsa marina]|uniref:Glycolate oxidase iron-sulfur subunit n=1 Tax=Thiohalocapsa marina TaxID=424902 RepID=A0A5M8FIS0_9GAMM|nr:glycolate oxidase subunit GlcF [Thiohalocapsa marina]KAA6184384.1 glycolate oxidase subunit GlcF [Thiohalocapsa marina]
MQTNLIQSLRDTADGREADRILRSCVHCGFCTATCPTYQLLGDELDGPRGRIYQIKNLLEGEAPTRQVQAHLDRCLTCLNCETTCPSGVDYHRLLDIGRERVEQQVRRPLPERLLRWLLRQIVPYPRRFRPLLGLGLRLRPLLPSRVREKLPASSTSDPGRVGSCPHPRQVILLENCVEPSLTPGVVTATLRVLDALGIQALRPGGGCCGAVSQHLSAPEQARAFMRRNIDAWWPAIEAGAEAILITASGCGAMVKEYGWHLRDDPRYAARAERVSALACDLSELLSAKDLARLPNPVQRGVPARIAFHPPCTLQHGQRLMGRVEALLRGVGFELLPVADSHSCCGSAGTYSILQPRLAGRLRRQRLDALQQQGPALIATANVGCQTHLQAGADVPVVHWIELFDPQRDAVR